MPLNRGIVGAVLSPFRTLVVHREAIELFVRRDIQSRYINSVLGVWWVVIQPLALLALYTFVFSYIMKSRLSASGSTGEFALYLFCGLLPWLAFADALTRSASVIVEQTPLIRKVVFPSEILPVHAVLSAVVVEAVGLAVLLGGLTAWGRPPGWALLVLPVVVVLQLLFTTGVAWLLATVAVFIRDTRHFVALGLTLWMFLTPIVYDVSLVPERFRWALTLNPIWLIVDAYRGTVLDARLPSLLPMGLLAGLSVLTFVVGHWAFCRSKHVFADLL
jgi:ABC-type polysaccharide/polyol phosphate export permease